MTDILDEATRTEFLQAISKGEVATELRLAPTVKGVTAHDLVDAFLKRHGWKYGGDGDYQRGVEAKLEQVISEKGVRIALLGLEAFVHRYITTENAGTPTEKKEEYLSLHDCADPTKIEMIERIGQLFAGDIILAIRTALQNGRFSETNIAFYMPKFFQIMAEAINLAGITLNMNQIAEALVARGINSGGYSELIIKDGNRIPVKAIMRTIDSGYDAHCKREEDIPTRLKEAILGMRSDERNAYEILERILRAVPGIDKVTNGTQPIDEIVIEHDGRTYTPLQFAIATRRLSAVACLATRFYANYTGDMDVVYELNDSRTTAAVLYGKILDHAKKTCGITSGEAIANCFAEATAETPSYAVGIFEGFLLNLLPDKDGVIRNYLEGAAFDSRGSKTTFDQEMLDAYSGTDVHELTELRMRFEEYRQYAIGIHERYDPKEYIQIANAAVTIQRKLLESFKDARKVPTLGEIADWLRAYQINITRALLTVEQKPKLVLRAMKSERSVDEQDQKEMTNIKVALFTTALLALVSAILYFGVYEPAHRARAPAAVEEPAPLEQRAPVREAPREPARVVTPRAEPPVTAPSRAEVNAAQDQKDRTGSAIKIIDGKAQQVQRRCEPGKSFCW